MSYGIVYLITNNLNGKKYIGQTTQPIEARLYSHARNPHCRYLHNAIKKYGIESFSVEILDRCDNQESLDGSEISLISKFNTIAPNGYNIKSGGWKGILNEEARKRIGDFHRGKPRPDGVKLKISLSLMGDKHPRFGKRGFHHSEDTKKKIGNSHRGIELSDEHKKKLSIAKMGRAVSLETREKISKANIGKPRSDIIRKKIAKAMSGKVASVETRQKISMALKRVSSGGRRGRSVMRGDGTLFSSASAAARSEGVDKSAITSCCRGRSHTCNGYTWQYVEDGNGSE